MADNMLHAPAEAEGTAERFVLARRGLVSRGKPLASARAAWLPAQVRVGVATMLPRAPAVESWPPAADQGSDEADIAAWPEAAPMGKPASSSGPSPRVAPAPEAAPAAAASVSAVPTRSADALHEERVREAYSSAAGVGRETVAEAGAGSEAVALPDPLPRMTEVERAAAPPGGAGEASDPAPSRRRLNTERDVRESVTRPPPATLPAALRSSASKRSAAGALASVPGNSVVQAHAASAAAEVTAAGPALLTEQVEPQRFSPAVRPVDSVVRPGPPPVATMGRFDAPASAPSSLRPSLPPSDLSALLSPLRPQRIVRIDRLDIDSVTPAPQAPPAAAMPAAAPAERPTAATPRPYRNPWSGYHARRD